MSDWFRPFKCNKNSYISLFCFHYGGGSASAYKKWAKDIIDQVDLVAIQLPGRENRFREPLLKNVSQVTNELYKNFDSYIHKPFIFFGHSIGALIAFEFARLLRKKDISEPKHLIVSAAKAPQLPLKRSIIHNLPDSKFVEEICKYNGIPNNILEDQGLASIFLPIIRADFSISETYQYATEEVLSFPITALGGLNDASLEQADLLEWSKQTSSFFEYNLLPGDHFFIRSSYQQVITIMNNILYKEISKLIAIK